MFGILETVVIGLTCFFAVVAIMIQTLHIRRKRGNRERESLISSANSMRRLKGKIRIQKATKVPTKHLRSQSIGLTDSPVATQKQTFKYPQQHYRRKSSPNISKIRPSTSGTLINIPPNFKCEKMVSLHQIQPTSTTPSPSSSFTGTSNSTADSSPSPSPGFGLGLDSHKRETIDNFYSPSPSKANINARTKPKHLHLPEHSKEQITITVAEKLTKPLKESHSEMEENIIGLKNLNNNNTSSHSFERRVYITNEK